MKHDVKVLRSVFCYCESRRRAHSAPIYYQVVYMASGLFAPRVLLSPLLRRGVFSNGIAWVQSIRDCTKYT